MGKIKSMALYHLAKYNSHNDRHGNQICRGFGNIPTQYRETRRKTTLTQTI
jgi:hypothetical protein